jgi:hypothetical protein
MDRQRIGEALRLGGLDLPEDLDLTVTGEEPVLPSPHHLATGAAAARVLTGVAANELWRQRTGSSQALSVDLRHAAAALRSYEHLTYLDGADREPTPRARRGPLITRITAASGDRHVQLHGSFRDGPTILEILGLDESASVEDVQAAVATWDAFDLEAAFIDRGICGGAVRSVEEWAQHPHGRELAEAPLVRITKVGDSPPEPLPEGPRPTSGIRVLDLTRVLAGPTCAKTLAEHGADVLKVTAPHLPTSANFDVETGIGKRQIEINLDDAAQADTLRDLVAEADVFSQGFRLGALAKRGFGPEQLAELRPGIVYVAENCYGHTGPWATRPGWEQLAQAATGMSHREGEAAGGAPQLAPAAVNDYSTGYLAAYGAMTALARRATEGGSWLVEVSLSRTSMWYQTLGDDLDRDAAERGDLTPFLDEIESASYGRLRYLKPALSMSETEPCWELPPEAPGSHEPSWLPR